MASAVSARRRRAAACIAPRGDAAALALMLVAGAGTVFSFAPFGLAYLPVVTLGLLFTAWRAATPQRALRLGLAFGLGLFGAGVPWVYVALNTFGNMPAPAAAIGTALFCLYLALFPAAAGWMAAQSTAPGSNARLAAAAAAWTLAEWLRSWLFTGLGWLCLGYAALPEGGQSALAGYGPVGGVFVATLALAAMAAALAAAMAALADGRVGPLGAAAIVIALVPSGGALLGRVEWTRPIGAPLSVSLVQGNVAQDVKFDPGERDQTFRLYTDMTRASRGRLVVLPESALPAFADEVPDAVLLDLAQTAMRRDGLVLTGVFTVEPPEPGQAGLRYYNSVVSLGATPPQLYRKRHLVPFGETIPLEPVVGWFIRSVLSIPLANQSAGAPEQAAFAVGAQRVAVDICYEDVFGYDIRPQARIATLLVNVTNDAWYARSLAAEQHNQIAAMRALETGRPMLRSTNTGITSAIAHDGRELARLPWFTRGTLEVTIDGRDGSTPYVRWGDGLAVTAALALLIGAGSSRLLRGAGRGRARRR